MRLKISIVWVMLLLLFCIDLQAQNKRNLRDSAQLKKVTASEKTNAADTSKKIKTPAQIASFRSMILPGLGQVYNKKYWKLPLVYAAIGFPVYTYKYNRNWYQMTRFAYSTRMNLDTANYKNIAQELQPLSKESLRLYRNEFRKNMDFSVIGIILMWGLNIVDATVDGHLRTFDISNDLTVKVKPMVQHNFSGGGLSLTFQLKDHQIKSQHSSIK